MKRLHNLLWLALAAIVSLGVWSCDNTDIAPVNKPTVGIQDVEFNKESMTLQALVIPSSDTESLYWKIEGVGESRDYTKVSGGAVVTASRSVEFGVEYTISAYSENKAGCSEVATKKYCPMPDSAAIAIGDLTLNRETSQVECTIYPSASTTKWYWAVKSDDTLDAPEWNVVDGNSEYALAIDYVMGESYELSVYAENAAGKSDTVSAEIYFEPDATLTIVDITFNEESMKVECNIAPSENTVKWHWRAATTDAVADAAWNTIEGNEQQTISFSYEWKQNYELQTYAENSSVESAVVSTPIYFEPAADITIGEVKLNEETMQVECTIYPSDSSINWYWKAYNSKSGGEDTAWTKVEGNKEQKVTFAYVWGETFELRAYSENSTGKSDEAVKSIYFEPEIATIEVSEPRFDEEAMTVSFDVTPSASTVKWCWGIYTEGTTNNYTTVTGNTPESISFNVQYDNSYKFRFAAENAVGKGEEKIVEFVASSPMVTIAIENLTAYTVDAVVKKAAHCARYAVGAVQSSSFDAETFIEQAKSSLDPDPSYPLMIFNTATADRTFTEQDLVRNSKVNSKENDGIIFRQETAYTIAAYAEDTNGNGEIYTTEIVVPKAEITGNTAISINMDEITERSASMTVTSVANAKIIMGYMDMVSTDPDNPFSFDGKSDAEIKAYIISVAKGVPAIYSQPISQRLSNTLEIDTEYMAFAIAIKDGKVGNVAYQKFSTKAPTLTGRAKITAASFNEQTSHETLSINLTADNNTESIRLYAAPESDHSAYADNLEYIMNSSDYQNYREEYIYNGRPTTLTIEIYHPGTPYYIYAVAVDSDGQAGELVNVARLAGLNTDYYTTIEEIAKTNVVGKECPGSFDMIVTTISEDAEQISVSIKLTNPTDNISKAWLVRLNGCKKDDIENAINEAFEYYFDFKMISGSYKSVQFDKEYKYENYNLDSFDPKLEALDKYDNTWGGSIIVAVALDTDNKLNICYYYIAGQGLTSLLK